jgi:hypothetical protein
MLDFLYLQGRFMNKGELVDAVPGFLTKLEEIGVKNCQNVYCKRIPAALLYDPK